MSRVPHITEMTQSNFEGVYFGILAGRSGGSADLRMPGWNQPNISTTRHVPGSNRSVTFQTGRGALAVSYNLHLATERDHETLQGLVGSSGTLQAPKRIIELSGEGVTEVMYWGRVYKRITNVMLQQITEVQVGLDGTVECVALFQRNERPA